MSDSPWGRFRSLACLLTVFFLSTMVAALADDPKPALAAHAFVPGFERLARADPIGSGRLLLGELNCVACHAAESISRKQAPVLDLVAGRVRPEYLRAFLNDPAAVKPGTTMPGLLGGLTPEAKADAIESLVHFLGSTGGVTDARVNRKVVPLGKQLYHQVGCVACHGPRDGPAAAIGTTVPLGDLKAKYTVPSLTAFLLDPLKSRPSGRMPALNLTNDEAGGIANYLLRDLQSEAHPNLEYRYYEGDWETLPDFAALKPVASGRSEGFDLTLAERTNDMGFQFQGVLQTRGAGDYTFHLTSDDGSKLVIDDTIVVVNDGIHPPQTKSGSTLLTKGAHPFVVEFFNGGGGAELSVEIQGPGLNRQPVDGFLALTAAGPEPKPGAPPEPTRFRPDPERAAKGRELFARLGCASCHALTIGKTRIESTASARPLAELTANAGCLADPPSPAAPRYALSAAQRAALTAALKATAPDRPSPKETIARTLATFNCYACHQRDGRGGVEEGRDAFFETTQKEMGDEGRIPPSLDGVGAKLTPGYFHRLFEQGAKDRPYMLTRMPRFGAANVGELAKAFATADPLEPVDVPSFPESPRKVKSRGRFLSGGEALGCIKCHTFKGVKSEGVQAIDMTIMTRRLNHDWFHRYLVNPAAFRPGTRMPSAWPDGKSLLPKVFDGDTARQIEAVWQFLGDGNNAAEPYGLGRDPIPLVADKEAVIYRNFIQGAGPRAIAVGYPEKANLAFDANDMRLALIWQGAFIDASRHWSGRGDGFQPPLGDNVVGLPPGPPFAVLPSPTHPWPTQPSKELGYKFRGYTLGKDQRPTFLYDFGAVQVNDHPDAIKGKEYASFKRTLTLTADAPPENLWFRAVVADKVEPAADGAFTINGEWTVRLDSGAPALVRAANGRAELLAPLKFNGKQAQIIETLEW